MLFVMIKDWLTRVTGRAPSQKTWGWPVEFASCKVVWYGWQWEGISIEYRLNIDLCKIIIDWACTLLRFLLTIALKTRIYIYIYILYIYISTQMMTISQSGLRPYYPILKQYCIYLHISYNISSCSCLMAILHSSRKRTPHQLATSLQISCAICRNHWISMASKNRTMTKSSCEQRNWSAL